MQSYNINLPQDKLELILNLLNIGLKAHRNNPGPVDIKLALAALPEAGIIELRQKITDLIS